MRLRYFDRNSQRQAGLSGYLVIETPKLKVLVRASKRWSTFSNRLDMLSQVSFARAAGYFLGKVKSREASSSTAKLCAPAAWIPEL